MLTQCTYMYNYLPTYLIYVSILARPTIMCEKKNQMNNFFNFLVHGKRR